MEKEDAFKRIQRYLGRSDTHPRLVNANNPVDLDAVWQQFAVGDNVFKSVSDFSTADEDLSEDSLFSFLGSASGNVFLTGFTSYYKLLGEQKLRDFLNRISGMSLVRAHVVLLCYQCETALSAVDPRYGQYVYLLTGDKTELPQLVFVSQEMRVQRVKASVRGVQNISEAAEKGKALEIFVRTNKRRSSYPCSLYAIRELRSAYDALCGIDPATRQLSEKYGTPEEWNTAFEQVAKSGSWMKYISDYIGNCDHLEYAAPAWTSFEPYKKWVYFIALKLFGAKNSWCLSEAAKSADSCSHLIREIYRSILSLEPEDPQFWKHYDERKTLIKQIGSSHAEETDYCGIVKKKENKTLYYLSDSSEDERNLIFETLHDCSEELGRERISEILEHVYPDLHSYLVPYRFNIPLLDSYFREYNYQKVVNRIEPDFLNIVNEQAGKREFNRLLPARSAIVDAIPKKGTAVCFVDAMGAEYLSYIMDKCKANDLRAYVKVCHCELPSLTYLNKEFVEVFKAGGAGFLHGENGIKALDELKHHGNNECDYTSNKLPTYIPEELEIIGDAIEEIATSLKNRDYERAVMISDHGASRLSVISGQENKWEMASKGQHSGRCCPVSEIDEQPPCSTKENGFWVLANYDRFKGGRPANIEVHGGATLEEVTVPVIEITYSPGKIEIELQTPKVKFRSHKAAVLKVFSKTKLKSLSVEIRELKKRYDGNSSDGQNFTVEIPDIKRARNYTADVYEENNLLSEGLEFKAENSGMSDNNIL